MSRDDWPREYMLRGAREIEGWVQADALALTLALHRQQRRRGTSGAVAEIGVHHGRFFLALALLRDDLEPGIAIDVFDRQDLNPDGSGRGDRAAFEANLAAWGATGRTHVLARDSLSLTATDLQTLAGPQGVRLFSVDGAHALRHVLNDLRLAEACLGSGGAILLDDLFHPHWPEVTEAAVLYLRGGKSSLVPLAICGGKLILVHRSEHAAWLRHLDARVEPYAQTWKEIRLCGTECRAIRLVQNEGLFGRIGRPTRAQRLRAPAALDFQGRGPAPDLLGAGWARQEAWGRWTDAPEATCRILLPPGLVPRRMVLNCGLPGMPAEARVTFGLAISGQALPPVTLHGARGLMHEVGLPDLPAGAPLEVTLSPGTDRVAVMAMGVFGERGHPGTT